MTPKTQPTTLQLARQLMNAHLDVLSADDATYTLDALLADPELRHQAEAICKEAKSNALSEYHRVEREYTSAVKWNASRNTYHISNLQEMAERKVYAACR